MTKVHRIAGLRISRVEPVIATRDIRNAAPEGAWRPKDDLPDLEPPELSEERLRASKLQIFSADAITLSHGSAMDDVFEPSKREEHKDFTAKATVYVMNAMVAVMSLPVGLVLFTFNILGGENLRTTAHVVALTGMGMALANTDRTNALMSLF